MFTKSIHMLRNGVTAVLACIASLSCAQGAWTSPVVDAATPTAAEYPYSLANSTITWYMTWDDTNLYIYIQNNTVTNAAEVYLDIDPMAPMNGGSNSNGNLVGVTSYDSNYLVPNLPFRADAMIYFKSTQNEYRVRDGSGGWGSAQTAGMTTAYDATNKNREISIPWNVLTNSTGRPASFNWLGFMYFYSATNNNNVFANMPTANSKGTNNVSPNTINEVRSFTCTNTGNGTSASPFTHENYTFVGTTDSTNFGSITVADFTLNSVGRSITRATGAGGAWTITGNFRVDNGTIDFGSSTNAATVSGNVVVGAGGTLKLSTASGGNLNVAGNFSNSGTFTPNSGVLNMNGTSAQTLSAGSYGALNVSGAGGTTAAGALSVSGALTLSGKLSLNGNALTHSGTVTQSGSGAIVTNSGGTVIRPAAASLPYTFHVGPDNTSYNPLTVAANGTNTADSLSVNVAASTPSGAVDATKLVNRVWTITEGTPGGSDLNLSFQWASADAGGSITPGSAVAWRNNGSTWVNQGGSTSGSDPFTTTVSGVTSLSPWTVGEPASLPVTLSALTIE